MTHVLTDDSDGGEIVLRMDGVELTGFEFCGELAVECIECKIGIFIAHGERGSILTRRLRHHEYAHALACECIEDSCIHTNNTDHAETGNGNQAGVADG